MIAYSKEFRRDVLAACDGGQSTLEVATLFGVSTSWVRKIKQDRRETGKVAPATTRRRRRAWDTWGDWLVKKIAARPDIYLRELQVELQQELQVGVSLWTLSRACRDLKHTRKKRR